MELMPEAMPHIAKQACYVCTRRNDVVDTGVFIVGEGVLGICTGCLRDMMVAGKIVEEDPEVLDRLVEAEASLESVTAERDEAQAALLAAANAARQAMEAMKPVTP